jgi:hypothetical protein
MGIETASILTFAGFLFPPLRIVDDAGGQAPHHNDRTPFADYWWLSIIDTVGLVKMYEFQRPWYWSSAEARHVWESAGNPKRCEHLQ